MNHRILATLALLALVASAGSAFADDTTFNVAANTSSVSFTSDAPLETITGTAAEISGTITTDLANPSATTATVTVPLASLRTGVDMRDEHLVSADWLGTEDGADQDIQFTISSVTVPDGTAFEHGTQVDATIAGSIRINGQMQDISVPATVGYFVLEEGQVAYLSGPVLRVTSEFDVDIADFGINVPGPLELKVAETVGVSVRLTATQG